MADPNLPILVQPTLEPTSALAFSDLITEVAYKIGCAYYGSDGQGVPQVPVDAHDLAICQRIVNKAIRKFINDGPKPNGWRWLNPIAQVDLWPQISYDPTGGTYVVMSYNASGANVGTTTLTLVTLPVPPQTGDIDTSYVPQFFQSMEMRQIWLNGNPPPTTPGFFLPIDEDFTGTAIGQAFTILRWLSPSQIIVDGNATLPSVGVSSSAISVAPAATGGSYVVAVSNLLGSANATIAFGACAATVQSDLQALANVGAGKVAVTGPVNGLYNIVFSPTLGLSVSMTLVSNSLTGTQVSAPFSFASMGDYTLPANFGGEYTGEISYVANTNRGMILRWTTEFSIRSRRQNYNIESGTPYEAAVRLVPTPSYAPLTNTSGLMLPRRRWELMTWRISSEFLSVIFPYTLAFNSLINLTDVPPSPFTHDEALKACCLAVAEKEVDDQLNGPDWEYYHTIALPQSWQIDSRSAPRAIGYFGNPTATSAGTPAIKAFRDFWYQRPTVPVFGRS